MTQGDDPFAGKPASGLTLYHGTRAPREGDGLRAVNEREVNGRKGKFLFATPYIAKTLMFAFDWRAGEALIGGSVRGSPDQFIIICEREKTLAKNIDLYVYSFSGAGLGFEKTVSGQAYVWSRSETDFDTREFATEEDVPASRLQGPERIRELDELMRRGLQIFSTSKTRQELLDEGIPGDSYQNSPTEDWLFGLLDKGFTWENETRGINPNQALKRRFEACAGLQPSTQKNASGNKARGVPPAP